MNPALHDFRWHLRTRHALGLTLDKVRMVDSLGRDCEVVHPTWWNLPRWWCWLLWTDGYVEMLLRSRDGTPVFLKMRTRQMPRPSPIALTFRSGRTLVPGPVAAGALLASEDPTHRLVPDDVLERYGVTHKG